MAQSTIPPGSGGQHERVLSESETAEQAVVGRQSRGLPGYIERHVAAVETYLDTSMRYLDYVGGMAAMWGPDVPLRSDLAKRLFDVVNHDAISKYHLDKIGSDARSAAMLMDSELARLVEAAEANLVGIVGAVNRTPPGQNTSPILVQVKKARQATEKVAGQLRKLQRQYVS